MPTEWYKYLNFLKIVSNPSWSANRHTLLKLYITIIRSKIDYGCKVYESSTRNTHQREKLKKYEINHMQIFNQYNNIIDTKYKRWQIYYTDGSKTKNGTGAVFVNDIDSHKLFLHKYLHSSVFTTELLVIYESQANSLK